jgi:hypothetical protein
MKSRVSATTALNHRDPIVLGTVWYSLIAEKAPNFSPTLEPHAGYKTILFNQ